MLGSADPTEGYRRMRVAEINSYPQEREELETVYGKVWNTKELGADFEVLGFMALYVVVRDLVTGKKGSMEFQDRPRYYYNFQEV